MGKLADLRARRDRALDLLDQVEDAIGRHPTQILIRKREALADLVNALNDQIVRHERRSHV